MKHFAALVFTLLLTGTLFAQEGLHIGFYGGPQLTRIRGQEAFVQNRTALESTGIWTFNGMAKIGYNIGPPFGFHLGFIYSVNGQDQSAVDTAQGRRISTEQRLNYIKIPLYLHFNSDPAPAMFTFEVGPQLNILRSATITDDGAPLVTTEGIEQFYTANDIAFAWSLGAEFAVTEWLHFAITHRGDYTIIDMENKDAVVNGLPYYENTRDPARNLTINFQAGMIFCISPGGGGGRNNKFWIR